MATLTLQGILTLTISGDGATRTDTLTDAGQVETSWKVEVLLSGTAATARTQMQQLSELAWYSRHCGGLYVATTHLAIDDGRYRLRSVDREAATGKYPTVKLDLERIGGGAAGGANIALRLSPLGTLTTNSYSIASTPWYAFPIGAGHIPTTQSRASADGTMSLYQSATSNLVVLSGADHTKGEVKVWDTGGSGTPANWTRVYGPDHPFASPAHVAVENGLVRLVPLASTYGCHQIEAWGSGSAWTTLTDASGDAVLCGGTGFASWDAADILELTPWRVQVRWRMGHNTSPYFVSKTITLDRGRNTARVDMAAEGAATWQTSILGAGITVTRRTANVADAADNGVETGAVTFSAADEPWVAAETHSTGTAMAIGSAPTTSYTISKPATYGGFTLASPSAASAVWWVGGVAYAATKLRMEAEAGNLFGGATITTVSGASGGASNNAVSCPASGDYCETTGSGNPPALGGRVRAYARIQNVGTSGSDEVTVDIWNLPGSAVLSGASTAKTFSALGSSGTWKWVSCESTAWNGTDTIYPRARRTASGGGGSLYVDQIVLVCLGANLDGPYAIGRAALTDTRVWLAAARSAL